MRRAFSRLSSLFPFFFHNFIIPVSHFKVVILYASLHFCKSDEQSDSRKLISSRVERCIRTSNFSSTHYLTFFSFFLHRDKFEARKFARQNANGITNISFFLFLKLEEQCSSIVPILLFTRIRNNSRINKGETDRCTPHCFTKEDKTWLQEANTKKKKRREERKNR